MPLLMPVFVQEKALASSARCMLAFILCQHARVINTRKDAQHVDTRSYQCTRPIEFIEEDY
jgi:hypothetical protein